MRVFVYFMLGATFLAVCSAHANTPSTTDDRRLQSDTSIQPLLPPIAPQVAITPSDGALEVDEATLLANPELLAHAMFSALVYDHADGVAVLLPIYQKQDGKYLEKELLDWAGAVLAVRQGDVGQGIARYQQLVATYPDNELLAVRLGQAYFANRQYRQARQVFAGLSKDVQAQLTPYMAYMDKQEKWAFSAGGHWIDDDNINNAPTNSDLGGGWTANPPISAQGVFVSLGAKRKVFLDNGAFFLPEVSVQGKRYHNAKQYNELATRLTFGMGKENAQGGVVISPFVERLAYAGGGENTHLEHFSQAMGVGVAGHKRLGNHSQMTVNGELAQTLYKTRPHLDGYSLSLSPSLTLYPKPNLALSVGTDHQYVSTQDRDDSYRRAGLRVSAVGQWQDVGASVAFATAKRTYFAPMPIFNQTQQNREYNVNVGVWHNRLAFGKFVPRLVWQYQKTDSNIALYSYDKSRVFVEVGAGF